MSERNLVIVTKIIGYYCGFYMGVKLYAVFSGTPLPGPQLVLAGMLFLLGFSAFYLLKKEKHNWPFALFGIVVVSALRYFENDLVVWLSGILG